MALPQKALLLIAKSMKDKGLSSSSPAYEDDGEDQESSASEERLLECAQHLIDGVKSDDAKAVAEAFKEMFSCCEMQPHQEADDDSE